MNAREYKEICNRADVMRRHTLLDTISLLGASNAELVQQLECVIAAQPITKPASHGGNDSDFFFVDMSFENALKISDILLNAEVDAVEKYEHGGSVADLVDTWNNYLVEKFGRHEK
jgi:hypothetical protein